MKLSDAMMLGDSLRRRTNSCYLMVRWDGEACGCAIGGATLAMGKTGNQDHVGLWPWLDTRRPGGFAKWDYVIGIGINDGKPSFFDVMKGGCTFESLVDYVRSVEPSCAECCEFECVCEKSKTQAEVQVEQLA